MRDPENRARAGSGPLMLSLTMVSLCEVSLSSCELTLGWDPQKLSVTSGRRRIIAGDVLFQGV